MPKTMTYCIAAHTVDGTYFPAYKSKVPYTGTFEEASKNFLQRQRELLKANRIACAISVRP